MSSADYSRLVVAFVLVGLIWGCGRPAGRTAGEHTAEFPPSSATTSAGALRVEPDATADGNVRAINIVGLTEAEIARFAALNASQRDEVLRVFVVTAEASDLPAMLGESAAHGQAVRFTPRYPLAYGQRYRVKIDRAALGATGQHRSEGAPAEVEIAFTTPARPAVAPTVVEHIYPSSDELPENQLKFYIHFSAPMSRGEAYQRLHLLDGDGRELKHVFLELGEELWSADMRRFTLLCDPARVKRGLREREELGPVLTAGRDYTLLVDRDWHDATGQPLAGELRKSFHVAAPDETPIDIVEWEIGRPAAGTRDPLVVKFPESLDHALLERMLRIVAPSGDLILGGVVITDRETRWEFTPAEPWQQGEHRLSIDTALEDLAGNAVGRPFDVDTLGPIQVTVHSEKVELPFTID